MQKSDVILVVDDTPTNLQLISEALTDVGFEVATAINGEMALKQIQYSLPDLILLDVMMPGINGFETCKRLKENAATCDIPVIFMTALSDTDSKVKGLSLGAVDYITKPFQEEELLARVKTHVELRNLTKNLEKKVVERTAELSLALEDLQESQIKLVQREKMSALGQLVAGIAHEINNPVGFISANLEHTEEYFKALVHHLQLYQQEFSQPGVKILEDAEDIDLEYLLTDLPKIIGSMQQGTERIRHISNSIRIFSRTDSDRKVFFNIHEGIDSTILILQHRLKANEKRPDIVMIKEYGCLPNIECYPGQINQVFMNLLANAIDAIEEANQERSFEVIKAYPNQITIYTNLTEDGTGVVIKIIDNGAGMSEDTKKKVFDQFFTTKAVGKGTGLGLSIVRQIVVDKHGGTLEVKSISGQGSEFAIALPVKDEIID
ncbi:hybrid sensor histidine kinase/response regulator [Cyanobacteria bacterium FACHB-472]|nr:hybrid sensor histidine kinase/response regulator [Cyanobacteria bacterium FACHB-472]